MDREAATLEDDKDDQMGEHAFDPWQSPPAHRLVFLADARTTLERRTIDDWLARTRPRERTPDHEIVSLGFDAGRAAPTAISRIEGIVAGGEPVYFVPLRVLWLPRPGRRTIGARLRELVLGDPHAPGPLRQRLIARRDPSRSRAIAADGATLDALQQRHSRMVEPEAQSSPGQFAGFITRQALLALERAERQLRGARYKMPRLVEEEILARPAFGQALAEVARNEGRSLENVEKDARECLREMAPVHSALAVDLMAEFGRYLYTRGFDPRVEMLPADLERVRELARTRPVVYLMTHKSHLDGFLLYTLFYDLDLPPVHTFGGINMSFLGLGTLGRRSGAIFIRRSFKDDAVYKLVLRQYIDYLAEKRFPLLWALEGTRSRTGKLMPPRYGLLSYVVDSYARSATTDLVLMPVSIVYDQVPEVSDYVAEAKGIAKKPESASWFMKYISGLNNPFGRIHVRFGQGVALPEALGGQPAGHGVDKLVLQKLAFQLAVDANSVTPVTASAFVTFVLLAHGHRALTFRELVRELRALLGFVRLLDLPTTTDIDTASQEVMDRVLSQLVHTGILAVYEEGLEPVYAVPPDAGMAAAYYRNTFVHFLVPSAITELALLAVADAPGSAPLETLRSHALRLRDLLKFEFFFEEKDRFLSDIERELELRRPGWRFELCAGAAAVRNLVLELDPLLAPGALRPFIESYWVAADTLLLQEATEPVVAKTFVRQCVALARQRVLQRRVTSIESASGAYFESALQLAANRQLLDGETAGLQRQREAFASEMAALVGQVDRLAGLAENQRIAMPQRIAPEESTGVANVR
jgi:glycerol-3-phosphate O-acyltransferase